MGHYRSEMLPDATEKAVTLFNKYKKTQQKLKTIPIGAMTIPEFKSVQDFLSTLYQAYEFNDSHFAERCEKEVKLMRELVKKCSSA
jgi:hypothetical protein